MARSLDEVLCGRCLHLGQQHSYTPPLEPKTYKPPKDKNGKFVARDKRVQEGRYNKCLVEGCFCRSFTKEDTQAEYVDAKALSKILREWVVNFLKEHESDATLWGDTKNFIGPVTLLSQRTGINASTVERTVNGSYNHVKLITADKLLTAIDCHYKLMNGEIEVIPHPNWSAEVYAAFMESRGCF